MNFARGLWCACALPDRPRAAFVAARGQEGYQTQKVVAALDQTVEAGLLQSQLLHEHRLFLRIVQLRNVRLQLGADGEYQRAFGVRQLLHLLEVGNAFRVVYCVFGNVRGIDRPLECQQIGGSNQGTILVGTLKGARQLSLVQMVQQCGEYLRLAQETLVSALCRLLRLIQTALAHLGIGENQLQIDDINVTQGIGAAFHVGHVAVVKAAHNVDDGIGRADVGEKLVSQSFAPGRALDQTGDVNKLNHGGREFLRMMQIAQPFQALVRHLHDADIGIDRAERIIVRRNSGVGDGVEQRGFSNIWQTDDT